MSTISRAFLFIRFGSASLMAILVEGLILASIFIGFFGIIVKRHLLMKILAMDVMSTGVIAYYVLISSRRGNGSPIVMEESSHLQYSDPLPQAVVLTAIVIAFSIQALLLVAVMRVAKDHPTLEIDDIEGELGS